VADYFLTANKMHSAFIRKTAINTSEKAMLVYLRLLTYRSDVLPHSLSRLTCKNLAKSKKII